MTPRFPLDSYSPKKVIGPLMVAVYNASGLTPTGNVHWNGVVAEFESLTGTTMDSFGNDTRGYPRLKGAITRAWIAAKKKGWAQPSPKRSYCLSEAGVAHAMEVASKGGATEVVYEAPPAVETPTPVAVVVPTAPVVVVVEPKGTVGVSWASPSGTPSALPAAYSDSYFAELAANQTRCFGAWSAKASPCKACPLAVLCHKSQVGAMSRIAKGFDEAFATATATPAPVVVEAAPEVAPEVAATPTLPKGAKLMPVAFETICNACGEVCEEGVEAVHLAGQGIFHIACAQSMA
jgi:hypothetical protein